LEQGRLMLQAEMSSVPLFPPMMTWQTMAFANQQSSAPQQKSGVDPLGFWDPDCGVAKGAVVFLEMDCGAVAMWKKWQRAKVVRETEKRFEPTMREVKLRLTVRWVPLEGFGVVVGIAVET
jgi:hypothetical protein